MRAFVIALAWGTWLSSSMLLLTIAVVVLALLFVGLVKDLPHATD